MKNNKIIWYIVLTLTYIFWGTQAPALKALSREVPLSLMTFLRFFMACLAILPFFLAVKNRKPIEKSDLKTMAFLGFLGVALYGMINITGIKLSTAVNQAIILHTWPLVATVLAPFLINEKVGRWVYAGLTLGFIGLVVVVSEGNLDSLIDSKYLLGNILIFLSGVTLALYSLFNKKYNHKYGGITMTFYSFLIGSFFLLLFMLISGDAKEITHISLKNWLLLFWAGVPTLALTWLIWFRAMREIGLVKANSFFLLIVPSGIFFSSLFLKETVTPLKLAGAALVLSGLYIVQTKK